MPWRCSAAAATKLSNPPWPGAIGPHHCLALHCIRSSNFDAMMARGVRRWWCHHQPAMPWAQAASENAAQMRPARAAVWAGKRRRYFLSNNRPCDTACCGCHHMRALPAEVPACWRWRSAPPVAPPLFEAFAHIRAKHMSLRGPPAFRPGWRDGSSPSAARWRFSWQGRGRRGGSADPLPRGGRRSRAREEVEPPRGPAAPAAASRAPAPGRIRGAS